MCGSLLDLPIELQSMVFGFLPDLDDALYLSHACRPLRCLYTTHKHLIERQIITSSSVYEYDLCLSKIVEANEDLAEIFKQHPNGVPPEKRPLGSIYIECINAKWTDRTLKDEEVERIAARWRQFGFLRDLYRDKSMREEFESYRAQFVSNLNVGARAVIVEPGVTEPGSFCLKLAPNSLAHSEFKARFYKTLCLHSIATSSLIFAKATIDQLRNDSHPPNLVGNIIANTTFGAWAKEMIVVGGEQIQPSQNDRLWSLEVFDFFYLFLLKKVIPLTKLDSWIHEQVQQWPYERWWYRANSDERTLEDTVDSWNLFIADCRWVLQPSDLVELIRNKSWSTRSEYPQDKTQYMRLRGMFDMGSEGDMDFYSAFTRSSIVDSLDPSTASIPPWENELPTWWDQVRANSGSPFDPGFRSRYLGELSKVGGMDAQIQAMEDEAE